MVSSEHGEKPGNANESNMPNVIPYAVGYVGNQPNGAVDAQLFLLPFF